MGKAWAFCRTHRTKVAFLHRKYGQIDFHNFPKAYSHRFWSNGVPATSSPTSRHHLAFAAPASRSCARYWGTGSPTQRCSLRPPPLQRRDTTGPSGSGTGRFP